MASYHQPCTPKTDEGVCIYAINVGQGDCILVEFYRIDKLLGKVKLPCFKTSTDKGTTCYLIDGGQGQKITDKINDEPANDRNIQHTKNKLDCLRACGCPGRLSAIIITHPDIDHYLGIKQLLQWYGKNFGGAILITEAFIIENRGGYLQELMTQIQSRHAVVNPSIQQRQNSEENHLTCHFNVAQGMLFEVPEQGQAHQGLPQPQQNLPDDNLTSIITTIDGTSVVLTGDSNSNIIEEKAHLNGKRIKIFQVPHHGSKNNSTEKFYATFEADVYLISGGGQYNHPNAEVLQGIIRANTIHRQRRRIIAVTNSYGLRSGKLINKDLPDEWWTYVTIYHTDDLVHYRDTTNEHRRSKQWITLDPAHCPPVPRDGEFNMPDNNLIEWSLRGYIEMIRRKVADHCEPRPDKPLHPFYHKCHVSIKNETGMCETDTIIAVPAPHQPWNGDSLNQCYIRESTLHQQQVLFLRPTGSQSDDKPNFYEYTYENPSVFKMSKTVAQTVKELPTVTVEISIGDNSRIEIGRVDNIVTKKTGLNIGDGDKIHAIYANNRPIANENFIDCLSQNVTEKTTLLIVYVRRNALDTMIV